ncbi:MAG: YihY/virulence factor BrkB family protein [Desulfobulbaceae bacterium]|nr:YihY/virulence factor BrkB family protein [Desulfobulbaceae bacterium]
MTTESSQFLTNKKEPFLVWLWSKPSEVEPILMQRLRTICRVIAIFIREFAEDAIPLRASALTFTIILSMVPMLALSTAVLKGLGAGDQMRNAAYQFIETLDSPVSLETPTSPPKAGKQAEGLSSDESTTPQSLTSHLKKATDTVFDYVEKTNFAALGIFGIAGLFITVISVLGTIEQAMNAVWQAESSRAMGRKIMDYLALMLLLPLAVNIGVAAMAALQSKTTLDILQHVFPMAWAGPLLVRLLSYLFLVMTLVILYRFLPNSRVPVFPALVGALVGAVGWLFIQSLYISLQLGVAKYNAIYGSFATLPLFFLWIYIGWMVFLSGAEVAFAVNVHNRYQPKQNTKLTPRMELALAYDLMSILFADFQVRKTSSLERLLQKLDYPAPSIISTLQKLTQAGLVRSNDGEDLIYLPATPAEQLPATEVMDVIFGETQPETKGGELSAKALTGARATLDTLAADIFANPKK